MKKILKKIYVYEVEAIDEDGEVYSAVTTDSVATAMDAISILKKVGLKCNLYRKGERVSCAV